MLFILFVMLLFGAACVAVFRAWLRIRRLRERLVVQTLSMIVSQNLPLVAALRSAALQERGALRRVFGHMARQLEAGDALSTALRCAMLSCSGATVGALQGAELGGTLPAVLHALAADQRRADRGAPRSGPVMPYFVTLSVIFAMTVSFLLISVIPKFHEIFADFDLALPPITQSVIGIGTFANNHPGWISSGLGVLILALLQVSIGRHFLVRVTDRLQLPFLTLDTLAWHLPLARQTAEARALARQLPVMQAAVRSGQDLRDAARQAERVDANYHARRRLRRWAAAIEQGTDPAVAARRLRFPPPFLHALVSAKRADELAAALEYLSSYYRSLLSHWDRVLASLAVPTLVISFGLFLGYVVVALFLPLTYLIDAMIDQID